MSMFTWASNLLDSVDSTAQETIQQQLSKTKAGKTPQRDKQTLHSDAQPPAAPYTSASPAAPNSINSAPTSTSPSTSASVLAPPVATAASVKADKSSRRQKRLVQQLPTTPPAKPAPSPPLVAFTDESAPERSSHAELTNGIDAAASATTTPASPTATADSVAETDGAHTESESADADAPSNSGDDSNASTPEAPATPSADAIDPAVAPSTDELPVAAAQSVEPVSPEPAAADNAVPALTETQPPPHRQPPTAAPVAQTTNKAKITAAASSLLPSASAFFSSALASAASSPAVAYNTPSSASSTSSAAAAAASSASSDAASEIASLRAVWNESREQVAKAKKLLALKEESHSKALQQLSHDWQKALDAQQAEHDEKARRLQEAMDRQTAEFQQAMATRKEHALELTAKEAEHADVIEQLQRRLQAAEERQQQLMDEREATMNLHSAALSQHQTLLARLRAEETERMASLEAELRAKTSSYAQRQERDTSQEEEQIQYTQIAAQVQRELEDKTRQLDRVMAEKRWIEADQQSLNDQLANMKTRVDEQHKQLQTLQAASRERAQAHTAELTSLKQQLASQQQQLQQSEQHTAALQQQLQDATATQSSSASTRPGSEWEDRLRAMTEHLMSKSTQIDRLSAERTALSVQLDDARARLTAFEKHAKKERERTLEDMEAGGSSGLKGMGSNGELMAGKGKSVAGRGVVQAVSALDWLGAMTGQMLRRHAWVRVSFAAYVFVIHVWVLFILFHLIGEMEGAAQPATTAVDGVADAANTFVRSRSHQLGNG